MSQQTAYRTHHATDVTEVLVGEHVTLAGWVDRRRDHGGVAFIDLRDNTGLVQVVINEEEMARPLRSEYVIEVDGKVRQRPEGNENDHLATGKVEVVAEKIRVLAKSDALPFQVSTALENESENKLPGEDVRLKYRYLDLRRPAMQRNIKLRSDMMRAARTELDKLGFTEVETPTMIKSTPEGARDFVVPARLVPGSWYALPQSPQLLKQLLMVAGIFAAAHHGPFGLVQQRRNDLQRRILPFGGHKFHRRRMQAVRHKARAFHKARAHQHLKHAVPHERQRYGRLLMDVYLRLCFK